MIGFFGVPGAVYQTKPAYTHMRRADIFMSQYKGHNVCERFHASWQIVLRGSCEKVNMFSRERSFGLMR